jgi:O-antigen ligase
MRRGDRAPVHLFRNASDSFFDFIENTRLGETLFRLFRFGVWAVVVFVVGRFAAMQFLSHTLQDVLFMAIVGVVLMLVLVRWEIGIILILATTSTIVYPGAMPTFSLYHFIPEILILEHLRLEVGQGLMLFIMGAFVISREARTATERLSTVLTPTVLLFCLAMFVASMAGMVYNNVYLRAMVQEARPYSFYLMFFVVLLGIRGRRELNILMYSLYGMAIAVAVLMYVQFVVGDRATMFIGSSIRIESFGTFAGRILPPGQNLIWMITPFVLVRLVRLQGWKHHWVAASLLVLMGGLMLTFTRSVWMGLILAMGIMAFLGRGTVRRSILRTFGVMGGFAVMLLLVLSLVSTSEDNYVAPYINRFLSVFKLESYSEGSSGGARLMEIEEAWPRIQENPWLGVGVGGVYRWEQAWDQRDQLHFQRGVTYMHNNYVLVLTKAGIIGLVTLLVMLVSFLVRARRIAARLPREDDRLLVTACIGSVAAVMLASLMQPSLWHPASVPLIGTIFGIVEVVRFLSDQENQSAVTRFRRAHAVAESQPLSRVG